MQTFQEKLQRDVAAKDRQLKMYQSTSSLLSPSSGAPAGSEMNSLRRAAEEAEEEASALREQTSRLQVQVSKVERTAKQSQARADAAAMEGKAQAASARRERKRMAVAFRGMADEVDAGEARAHSLLRLTVGCRRGVALRARERECDERFGEDLEQAVDRAKDAANQEAREQVVGLQKQVVESADALLASERKFSQLLAWVQKGKEAQLAKR
ncbi:hypothetical protein T484DRAFT_2084380 [Baffinella frigidus]|nr:hypothetical protein T484DRAFT_2084380 [Cryptophyta sp. CCMP2293]